MPKNKKGPTLLRQWEMMRMLAVSRFDSKDRGIWSKASDITAKLNAKGHRISTRSVQRDLKELQESFAPMLESNTEGKHEYGWRWCKGFAFDIPGMGVSEALAMRLVEMHLQQLLPAAMLEGLQGIFGMAELKLEKLATEGKNPSKTWLNKIRVVPPAQTMLPPVVNQQVQAEIYQALMEDRQLNVFYESTESGQLKESQLHPLGLIMRGAVAYLVASAWDYPDIRLYALHRFNKVKKLKAIVKAPEGFDLDKFINSGRANFANQGEPIQLTILCTEWVANMLSETPLAIDQNMMQEPDGRTRVTAIVNDTWQLRWWLLGQGAGLEVCAPAELRSEMKSALKATVRLYN